MSKRSYEREEHRGYDREEHRGYDREEHRGYKRYREDESEVLPKLFYVFLGEVVSVQPYGAFVKIPGFRKQGLVHKSQMSQARVDDPSEMVAKGEKVHCKVINVEIEGQKIGLSMKVVNQTTGKDLDPNNVQHSMEERKKQKGFRSERPKIELGAELNTTCARCGGKGHFSQDCYYVKGEKQYDLIPDMEELQRQLSPPSSPKKKKKKKEKKHRSEKTKRHHSGHLSHGDEEKEKHKNHVRPHMF
ncbi:nucleolar protein of 40 kDa-like isoform X2 [Gigantopelta aegis]|uniref:nucleolar protein of 40 kDa-like isoform X2 n=1 Tax=Gigantopelta aegis TaxID=1735272 RepID=UPI001B88A94A|nr:nucleolar protein of 40 kDa-like isoform X2 [Gigantopelta aegis]